MAYLLITLIVVFFFGRKMMRSRKEHLTNRSNFYKEKYQNYRTKMLVLPFAISILIYIVFPHEKFALPGKKTVLTAEWTLDNWIVKQYVEYADLPNLNSKVVKWFGYTPMKEERVYYEVFNSSDSSKIEILKQSKNELNIIYEKHR